MSAALALRRWLCEACGLVYDEARGDPDSGIAPGTRFEDIPDDWRCPVCGVGKSDFVAMDALRPPAASPAANAPIGARPALAVASGPGASHGVVIVGAGIAGWSVARSLREAGHTASITMVTACDARVYQKPLLSVALARGLGVDAIGAQSGESLAQSLSLRLMTRTWAIDVDLAGRRVHTTRGTLRYDALVLATGSRARALACAGDAADRLMPINDLAQYTRMRGALDAARVVAARQARQPSVAIVGAGLVGCELAEDLSAGGARVTLLETAALPLQARLDAARAAGLRDALVARGVRFVGNARLLEAAIPVCDADMPDDMRDAAVELHWTSDADAAPRCERFDLAIGAVGTQPQTRLARTAGLAVDRGVRATEAELRVDAATVFALGDCAEVDGELGGTIEPIHRQAAAIAGAIVGQPAHYQRRAPTWVVKTPCYPLVIRAAAPLATP